MRITKNKIFMMLICLIITLSNVSIPSFASTSKNDYKNLLDKGFSVNQIENMPSELFKKLNRPGYTNVSKDDAYYRITYNKDTQKKNSQKFTEKNYLTQYRKDLKAIKIKKSLESLQLTSLATTRSVVTTTPDITEVNWLRLTTGIDYYGPDDSYELSSFFEWKTTPSYRLKDVVGIGISDNFSPITDTQFFSAQYDHYHYDVTNGPSTVTEYIDKTSPNELGQGGIGFYYNLPMDEALVGGTRNNYSSFMGYMTFSANLNKSVGTTYANAYGDYSHQQWAFGITPTISYPLGGAISIAKTSHYDSVLTNCQATIN